MTGLKADNHPSNLFRVWSEVLALPLPLFVQGNYWFMYFYVHAFFMLAGHAPREYSEKGREGLPVTNADITLQSEKYQTTPHLLLYILKY